MAIQALLLDVGGVFLVPDGKVVAESLTGAGIPIERADYERAHFAGIVALDQGVGAGEDKPRYLSGYIDALGVRRAHLIKA